MAKNWRLVFRQADRAGFERIRTGEKAIETRAATIKYQSMAVGDTLTFVCGGDQFIKTITNVYRWPDIDAMLAEVPLKSVMPEIETPEQMKKAYASYPRYEEKIREFGLIGVEMA